MKKIVSILLICMLLSCFGVSAEDMITVMNKPITVTYNGEDIQFPDALPLIQNDKTLVPARAIMERARLTVDFDEATRAVTAQNADLSIHMLIDDTQATVTAGDNVQTVVLEEPARIIDDRTYVPIRFVAESLGTKVNWNPSAREVVIIDTDEWKQEITEKSALFAKLLDQPLNMQKPMAESTSGDYRYIYHVENLPVEGSEPIDINMDISVSFTGTSVFDGTNTGAYLSLETDLSFLKEYLADLLPAAEATDAFARPYTIDLELIVDPEWNLYVKSDGILEILTDAGMGEIVSMIGDRYVRIPLKELLAPVLDLSALEEAAASAETLWDFIEKFVAADDVLYTQSVVMLDSMMSLYATLYADEQFTVTEQADGSELWTYTLNPDAYADAVLGMLEVMNGTMGIESDEATLTRQKEQIDDMGINMSMTITFEDGVATKAEAAFTLSTTEELTPDVNANLQYTMNVGSATRPFDPAKDKTVSIPSNVIDLEELTGAMPERTAEPMANLQ